jgi:hypothetical protein
VLLPRAGLDLDPPLYASHMVGITDKQPHAWLFGGGGVLLTFCSGWP